MLERSAAKVARSVLRRGGGGNVSSLSDSVGLQTTYQNAPILITLFILHSLTSKKEMIYFNTFANFILSILHTDLWEEIPENYKVSRLISLKFVLVNDMLE